MGESPAVLAALLVVTPAGADPPIDLVDAARDGTPYAVRIRPDAEVQIGADARPVPVPDALRILPVLEATAIEVRGLHCDRFGCVQVVVPRVALATVVPYALDVYGVAGTGVHVPSGTAVDRDEATGAVSYHGGGLRVSLPGMEPDSVSDLFAVAGSEQVGCCTGRLLLAGGTALRDAAGRTLAVTTEPLSTIQRGTVHGRPAVEVAVDGVRVVGVVEPDRIVEDRRDVEVTGTFFLHFGEWDLAADTRLYAAPDGALVGYVLRHGLGARRLRRRRGWTCWRVRIGDVHATVWTRGAPAERWVNPWSSLPPMRP